MTEAIVKELREEALWLAGRSIDRGCVDSSIAASLAEKAADRIEALEKALGIARGILSEMCRNGHITTDPNSEGYKEYFVPTTVFDALDAAALSGRQP